MAAVYNVVTNATAARALLSKFAMADAVTKLLIEKGVISEAEFTEKLLKERTMRDATSLAEDGAVERSPSASSSSNPAAVLRYNMLR
jgi:hypothetical protein